MAAQVWLETNKTGFAAATRCSPNRALGSIAVLSAAAAPFLSSHPPTRCGCESKSCYECLYLVTAVKCRRCLGFVLFGKGHLYLREYTPQHHEKLGRRFVMNVDVTTDGSEVKTDPGVKSEQDCGQT